MVDRTYAEINAKIKSGQAAVVTAEELVSLVKEKGVSRSAVRQNQKFVLKYF